MPTVYLNGQYLPIDEAMISVCDRGFLLADGVYEVIPVLNGRLFRLEEHLERLEHSLSAIQLDFDCSTLPDLMTELIGRNGSGNQSLYLQITRGCDPNPVRRHVFPTSIKPTLYISSDILVPNSKEKLAQGATAITLPDLRWHQCQIKTIGLLANVLAAQEAKNRGAIDAILIREGHALEGASSNLFIIKDNILFTSPLNETILGGVTRSVVLELAKMHHIPFEERDLAESELYSADEIWLTSSTKDIVPILMLNEAPIGTGEPGPLWHRMIDAYFNYREKLSQYE